MGRKEGRTARQAGYAMPLAVCALAVLALLGGALLAWAGAANGSPADAAAAARQRIAAASLAEVLEAQLTETGEETALQAELRRRLTDGGWPWTDAARDTPAAEALLTLAVAGHGLPAGDEPAVTLYWQVDGAAWEAADPETRFADLPPALCLTVRCGVGGPAVTMAFRLQNGGDAEGWYWRRERTL